MALLLALLSIAFIDSSHGDQPGSFRVVIDPGHGGTDEGAKFQSAGNELLEKNLTLKLAQQLARDLRAKRYQVFLTRKTDKNVSLPERTALANQLNADVFISLHFNAARGYLSQNAQGIETFILNQASDESAKRLAALENSVLKKSKASQLASMASASLETDSGEEKDYVSLIVKDHLLSKNLTASKNLACLVQNTSFQSLYPNKPQEENRGVKQGLFYVLLGADMPSILFEGGFLTHPEDRQKILSHNGLSKMSQAMTRALSRYRSRNWGQKRHNLLSSCKIH